MTQVGPFPDRPPDLPPDWPHANASRLIAAPTQLWHVQQFGAPAPARPALLLLHGAGGSLHCWAGLAPLLAAQAQVIALDLAGHGFSQMRRPGRYGLNAIAADLADLVQAQGWPVQAVIGHSAGAAIALRLCQHLPLRAVVGVNAALAPFDGVAGWLFPALAKSLARLPFVPLLAARALGTPAQIDRLVQQTGAQLDAAAQRPYLHLAQNPRHVGATLSMMAAWNLPPLLEALPAITQPTLLITGSRDGAVSPMTTLRAEQTLPHASAQILFGRGHLLPEETPTSLAALIKPFMAEHLSI